jgi:hypothetical protein
MARLRVPKFPETITVYPSSITGGVLEIGDPEDVTNGYLAMYRLDSIALRRVVRAKLATPPANTATPLGMPAKKRGRAKKAELTAQKCEQCGDETWWDETQPVICDECQAGAAEADGNVAMGEAPDRGRLVP